jgi:tripartite-type tricarboxylate transporter receptor subunit TctC
MKNFRCVISTFMGLALALAMHPACAQEYPSKTLRIITGTAGGITDLMARMLAQELRPVLGQTVVVDNRGGGGMVSGPLLAKSPPDGYTILLYSSTVWLSPLMRDNPPFDALRDFAPITMAAESPQVLAVHPSVPAKSVKELIALAKAQPGVLNYASTGSGAGPHLGAELLKSLARVDIQRINYKGTAPALTDLLSGQVQMMFCPPVACMPHVKTGKLRVLGSASAKRSELVPDVPTIASQGLPRFELVSKYGMFAPAKTPVPIVTRLNHEIVRILKHPDTRVKLLDAGAEPIANSPQEALAMVKSEITELGKVIREAGIRED